jgi:hypothetical protein
MSDAVDWGPSVKRFSDTADQNEFWKLVQGRVVLSAIDSRRIVQMEWLVNVTILLEAPNYCMTIMLVVLTKKKLLVLTKKSSKTFNEEPRIILISM